MKILSIDGGGIRGLLPAFVLAAFEERLGRPLGQCFDLVVGTSTGGIIALGIAAGIPAMRLADLYLERGPAIFSRSLKRRVASVGGLADELYDAGELETALAGLFEDRLLSSVATRTMAVAYDIEAREKVLFRSWCGGDYRLADVARATSAAPVYFEPYAVRSLAGEACPCIDGGIVANNPVLLALAEADERPRIVSIGTGQRDAPILLEAAKSYGAVQWAPRLVDLVFTGQAEEAHLLCRRIVSCVVGGEYVRLQTALSENVEMDATDARSLAVLRQAASRLAAGDDAARALQLAGAA